MISVIFIIMTVFIMTIYFLWCCVLELPNLLIYLPVLYFSDSFFTKYRKILPNCDNFPLGLQGHTSIVFYIFPSYLFPLWSLSSSQDNPPVFTLELYPPTIVFFFKQFIVPWTPGPTRFPLDSRYFSNHAHVVLELIRWVCFHEHICYLAFDCRARPGGSLGARFCIRIKN